MGRSIVTRVSTVALVTSAVVAVVLAASSLVVATSGGPGDPQEQRLTLPLPEPGGGQMGPRLRSGVTRNGYVRAVQDSQAVPASPLSQLHPWVDRGPADPGGRVTDLAWDGSSLWVASASGGLWRTDESAAVLTPVWPDTHPPAVGAVAIMADGTILAGTGEANAGGGSTTFAGDGIYRSSDGGVTWTHSGLSGSPTIARIIPHPTDDAVAWAAAGGDLYRPGGDRGIYRTADGGRTWTQVLAPATSTAGGADITIDPSDPDHLLATTWDRQRTPSLRRYGGVGSGMHASSDGGLTWTAVTEGIPGFTDDVGRIAVAFSPAAPRTVYAVVTGSDGRGIGLFRSDDGGTRFITVNDGPQYRSNQFIFGYWFSKVFPAPDDADHVIVPGLNLTESRDGGQSFTIDSSVHPDQHALIWDPADPARAWLGTDGGVYMSADGGASHTWEGAAVQPFTQAYDVAAMPGSPSRVAAGFQDNSCLRDDVGFWRAAAPCGDGTTIVSHPTDPEFVVCGQYARCWLSGMQGSASLARADVARAAWSTPVIRLEGDPDALLLGGERLMRSDDGGGSWRPISPDLSRGESPDPDYAFGTITEILALDDHGQSVVVGTDDGLVQVTHDGGASWRVLLDGTRWVTGLAQSPDGESLLVSTSGFFAGEGTAQVRQSDDGGASWRDIADGLPDAPANDLLVVDDGGGASTLVVATDVGVYAAGDHTAGAPTWRRVGEGLPQVPVLALDHVATASTLTIGTFGRGIWQTTLTSVSRHGGADRFSTAVQINDAARASADAPGVTVVLASGENPADALAAAPLVARRPAWTMLLTRAGSLPSVTAQALQAARPDHLVIVGGPAAISDEVAEQARAASGASTVRRIAGPDRTATAAALAAEHGEVSTVLLTTTASPFDALSGAPLAAAVDGAVLAVHPTHLPESTADALRTLAPSRIIALGGTSVISDAVLDAAAAAAAQQSAANSRPASTERIAGTDRIATSVAVALRVHAERGAAHDPDAPPDEVWLASAASPSDALVAASSGHPLLLTSPSALPRVVAQALADLQPVRVRLAGGPASIGDDVVDELRHGSALPAATSGRR